MEVHRFKSPHAARGSPDPFRPCRDGDCVWQRWARRSDDDGHGTVRARMLRAYLLDVAGLCHCPRRRFSRWA